jgi:hypothetical protein
MRKGSAGITALWLVPALFLASTVIFHSNNLGLRHALIVYPFLIIIGTSILPQIRKPSVMTYAGLLLTALFLLESIPAMHNSIPFFNQLSRKPAYEGKLLADSNIDWGQDLARLSYFCMRNDIRHLHLRYFGTADPNYHLGDIPGFKLDIMGPEYNDEPGPPGWYAVSLQKLLTVRAMAKDPGTREVGLYWLREMKPYARVGGSIFIYHIPPFEE